jgi:hypothetical protein
MGHTSPEEEPFIYLMKKIQVARDMLLDTSSQVRGQRVDQPPSLTPWQYSLPTTFDARLATML